MSKLFPIIIVTIIIVSVLVVLNLASITSRNSATVTSEVYDALGRRVSIRGDVKRVVSLSPSLTETMFELGLDHLLIGVDQQSLEETPYLNVSEKLKERNITGVGGYWWPSVNLEKILSLSPDLVLADKGAHMPLKEFFESYNITTVYFNGGGARTVEEVYQDILLIGRVFNKQAEAEELVSRIDRKFQEYRNTGSKYGNISVLVVVSIDQAIWVAGPETFIGDVLTKLGVKNACANGDWVGASFEMVAQWNPTVIIIASERITPDVISASGLDKLNSTIIVVTNQSIINMYVRPGPSIAFLPDTLTTMLEGFLKQSTGFNTNSTLLVAGAVSNSHGKTTLDRVVNEAGYLFPEVCSLPITYFRYKQYGVAV